MNPILFSSLLLLNILIPLDYYYEILDLQECHFVDASCYCCYKSLNDDYRYYRLDCNHTFCCYCFKHCSEPSKSCFVCGKSLEYPEVLRYPDLFGDI